MGNSRRLGTARPKVLEIFAGIGDGESDRTPAPLISFGFEQAVACEL